MESLQQWSSKSHFSNDSNYLDCITTVYKLIIVLLYSSNEDILIYDIWNTKQFSKLWNNSFLKKCKMQTGLIPIWLLKYLSKSERHQSERFLFRHSLYFTVINPESWLFHRLGIVQDTKSISIDVVHLTRVRVHCKNLISKTFCTNVSTWRCKIPSKRR